MKTTIEDKDGIITIVFEGRMDTIASPEVQEAIQPVFSSKSQEVYIDCSNLEYVSSSGLRIFLSLAIDTQSSGKRIVITGWNEYMKNLFEMTGFTELFEFE